MSIQNVEFKARVKDLEEVEKKLLTLHPRLIGIDHQIDTYFHTPIGRLKLREGNIENALIHYERADIAGSKESKILLYQHTGDPALKKILTKTLGVKIVVDKYRKIYFIDHVKFHFDEVEGLGRFLEVEVIDANGTMPLSDLQTTCDHYREFFGIEPADLVKGSYSDLLGDTP
jgi:predicted adenylyl cyclase CyaB